jgi:membrane protease YdiL (CAAX protease family)
MKVKIRKTDRMLLCGSLLLFPLVFIVNYAFHHQVWPIRLLPSGRLTYYFLVAFACGAILPAVVINLWAARGIGNLRRFGFAFKPIDLVKILVALAVGAFFASFPIGEEALAEPGRIVHLFVWLLSTSIAEALVFLGIVYNVCETFLAGKVNKYLAIAIAALVSSVCFGLYHFSYPPPWNTLGKAALLTVIWLEVSAVYILTRSLWAAAAFNNVMAIIGFVLNNLTIEGPLALGFTLDAISVVSLVLVYLAFFLPKSRIA